MIVRSALSVLFAICLSAFYSPDAQSQCTATLAIQAKESRCKATGEIIATVTGGSGSYNYKVINGAFSSVTSTNTISGLQAGTYTVEVKDVVTGCIYTQNNVVVTGNYQDPRFQLTVNDVTCINGNNGRISVTNLQYGRGPFQYTIVAPSTSAIGTSNSTGVFNNLVSGDYYVRLTDSCGGMQTRAVTIANYNWWVDVLTVAEVGCDQATATISLRDSKGNTNLSGTTFNGYSYGVVRAPGDTLWYSTRSFTFFKGTLHSFTIVVKDLCGLIKTSPWSDNTRPTVASTVTISNQVCAGFRATITGQQNLTNPQYCLYNSANTLVTCNTTGVFDVTGYGSYCIRVRDLCYDTTILRCFTVTQPVPAVASTVSTSNLACSTFTATITGQANLISPTYCLYNSSNVLITCNGSGSFNNVPYGSYCIRITDGCTGTVINRCFTRSRPIPSVDPNIAISNNGCTSFSATVTGQQNLNNPQYCIYNASGILIACNSTGVFNGLGYGNYCINVTNNSLCYDTVIRRCFTVNRPVPSVAATVAISNQTCNDFRANVTGQTNLNNPNYCLYNSANVLINCNTTGQFNNLAYGSYCVRITNNAACYDTVIQRCFTVTRPVPSVSASVTISNRGCATFTAAVTGQTNINNPQYCLFNSSNVQVACNGTGSFNNIPYGSYCIRITNNASCYDTVIQRCFTSLPIPMALNVTAAASCTIGLTDFNASWASTTNPYTINVYNPGGMLIRTVPSGTNSASITGLPGLPVGLRYKVVITDNCGNKDSALVTPNASWLNKSINTNAKCPSGQWQNGSGDLIVFSQYSSGSVTPRIIRKNATTVTINYNFNSGSNYTFSNMEPATYVVEYSLQGCSGKVYDTFNLPPYTFPSLGQSAVYQCNNNSFGVNSVVSSGLSPFTYEIMGSQPSFPNISAAPQASPMFNINNGNSYSLVRLRAVDACGNATINDASILPLANTVVSASSNCFYDNITLNVDTIANATYTWYKKTSPTDSILISSAQTYNIPYFMPTDTGVYICKVSVNSGCLTRVSSFSLQALCGGSLLPSNNINFSGLLQSDKTLLQWKTGRDFVAEEYIVERSLDGRTYTALGTVKATGSVNGFSRYLFTDNSPEIGKNYYRLKIKKSNGSNFYSTVVVVDRNNNGAIQVTPNPVFSNFNIRFTGVPSGNCTINLINATGGLIYSQNITVMSGESKSIQRPPGLNPGTYFLVIYPNKGEKQVFKLLFH